LSGDIGVAGDSTDNSLTILYALNTDDQTRLDGLIFEYGNANGPEAVPDLNSPLRSGGAIFLDGESEWILTTLNLRNCIFRQNRARYFGGAIYVNGYVGQVGIKLDHCVLEYNYAQLSGGGLSVENYAPQQQSLEFTDCLFRENKARYQGGGVWARHNAAVRVKGCSFLGNTALAGGAGILIETFLSAYPRSFEDCDFYENKLGPTGIGSAIHVRAPNSSMPTYFRLTISNCRFYANLEVAIATISPFHDVVVNHCLFQKNDAVYSVNGGDSSVAYFSALGGPGRLTFNQCLFYKNLQCEFTSYAHNLELNNCILISQEGDGHSLILESNTGGCILNNCIVGQPNCNALVPVNGATATCNNVQFATDPLFIAPTNDINANFHLQPCSPAINAGLSTVVDSFGLSTDFDGNLRVRNGRVDIGLYETNVFLAPDIVTTPSCAGASDGAFSLSGNICTPYTVVWNNGSSTGTSLTGLPAGTYSLSITDANDLTIQETVVVPAQDSLILSATVYNASCAGEHTGYVQLSTSGGSPFPGIPPYEYAANNPPTMGLAAGVYTYTVSDANGCSATVSATVTEPPPFIVYYTVKNASGAMQADGAIYFDSTSWGGGAPLADLINLLPNTYHFTVTDTYGCQHAFSVVVGYSSATKAPVEFPCRIYPNPGFSDTPFYIESSEKEGFAAKVYDQQGRLLRQQTFASGGGKLDTSGLPAGVYRVEARGSSGARGSGGLQILRR